MIQAENILKVKKALGELLAERVMFVPMAFSKGFFCF